MAKSGGIDGVALAVGGVGALLLWSGFAGKGVLAGVQGLIKGIAPADIPAANAIAAPPAPVVTPGGAATGGTVAGESLAADAEKYIGTGYVFGGAPAKGSGNWDCSSFVNKVVGIDNGLAIPGYAAGTYKGTSHGPTALVWSLSPLATTIGSNGVNALPGDLCCWQTHVGIAIGGGVMVSARSTKSGTGKSTINDVKIAGEHLTIRRLKAVSISV